MGEHEERALVCRNRAEEMHQLAEGMTSKEAKKSLLETAASYDRMADCEEALAKDSRPKNSN